MSCCALLASVLICFRASLEGGSLHVTHQVEVLSYLGVLLMPDKPAAGVHHLHSISCSWAHLCIGRFTDLITGYDRASDSHVE